MNKYRNLPLGISELEIHIIILHECLWLQSLCQISSWRRNMEELHFQSSKIQIKEQFGCVWIYHTINSSHMQTNAAAVPWASRQHEFVDDTQIVAVISSCSLLANLFNGLSLENCAWPQMCFAARCAKLWSAAGGAQPEHWWETCSLWLLLPAFGNQFFRKQKAFAFWKPANTEMSQIGQPREQLILWGLLVLWFFFPVGRHWLRKGELQKQGPTQPIWAMLSSRNVMGLKRASLKSHTFQCAIYLPAKLYKPL